MRLNTIISGRIHFQLILKRAVPVLLIICPLLIFSLPRLPIYEASHEFNKRGCCQQPLQVPATPQCSPEQLRLPPPPTISNPPLHYNRAPPARDTFSRPTSRPTW